MSFFSSRWYRKDSWSSALVVLAEALQGGPGLGVAEAQLLEDVPGQVDAGEERLPDHMGDAQLEQLVGVRAVPGAGEDDQVREMLLHLPRSPQGGLHVVDGEDEHLRLVRPRRPEQVQARGVAVEDLVAEALQEVDLRRVGVHGGEGDAPGPQHPADDLPESPEARDDDRGVLAPRLDRTAGRRGCGAAGARSLSCARVSSGVSAIDRLTTSTRVSRSGPGEDPVGDGEAEEHERELAPLAEDDAELPGRRPGSRGHAGRAPRCSGP